MKLFNQTINPLAIGISAVAAFMVGFVWYSFLFKTQWVAGHNFTPEQIADMGNSAPGLVMALSFIGYVITATVLSLVLSYARATDLNSAWFLTALIWVGFPAIMALTGSLYAGTNLAVYFIDAGYQLVYSLVMATIINRMP